MQQELVKATEELQKMKNEKKQSDRLSLVSEKLGMSKVEAEEVTSLLDKLEDSSFAGFIAKQSEYLSKKMSEYEADAKKMAQSEMPKEKDTEEETDTTVCSKCGQSIGKKAMAEEDTAENIATEETLESAEVKEGADLNFSDVKSDPVQAVASQIASYLGVELGNLKNNEE